MQQVVSEVDICNSPGDSLLDSVTQVEPVQDP